MRRSARPAPGAVADLVRWFWVPEWDVDPGRTSRQHVVGYPGCHLVVESRDGGLVGFAGPTTRASHQDLTGRGWAVGALLQPAAVPASSPDPAADRDRYRHLDEPALVRDVTAAMTSAAPDRLERATAALAGLVADRVGPVDEDALAANAVVALVESDPGADLAGIAADHGHADHGHLTREFRRVLGTAPSEYRRATRQD